MVNKELESVYICSDGKKFLDKKEADKYEEGINSIVEHYNILGKLEIIDWRFCSIPGTYVRDQVCS